MSAHGKFNFKSADELRRKAADIGVNLPFAESTDNLLEPVLVGAYVRTPLHHGNQSVQSRTPLQGCAPNRICVQPMEGFDSDPDGSPGDLCFRRYRRYAAGGSGLIWFEATAILQEGRSNPRQLMLCDQTVDQFASLAGETRKAAADEFGSEHNPYLVLQITHSGRYSRPEGRKIGKVCCFNPYLDELPESVTLFSDDELDGIQDQFVKAAGFAYEAGFDSVDVKVCHGYLLHELIGAHTRTGSKYGGDFENRSRFVTDLVKRIRQEYPDKDIAVRLNATDNIPFPYGFGMDEAEPGRMNLNEARKLTGMLIDARVSLMNITAGVPYHSPQYVRPFNRPVTGSQLPDEHPLTGVARLIGICADLQSEHPDIPFVASGLSWLKHHYPNVGSALIENGMAKFVGLGRNSFAYPDSPKDLMHKGRLDSRKSCVACSKCTELMRADSETGCVTRDSKIYLQKYRKISASGV